ncbi:MAG: helix-hairpin-helix domain-containing protein [bacterium]
MTVAAIAELTGVGPQLAQAIRTHFKTDAEFLAAAGQGHLDRIAAVPGVSPRKAQQLVRQVQGKDDDGFLATPAARKIKDEVLEILAGFACTAAGRNQLKLLAPLASKQAAGARVAHVMQQKTSVQGVDRDEVRRLLRKLRLPQDPAPRREPGRLVVADEGTQERLHKAGVHKWAALGGPGELSNAGDYEVVLVLGEDETPDVDNVIDMALDATLEELAPESVLSWFSANRSSLEAAAGLGALLAKPQRSSEALALLDASPPAGPPPDLAAEARAIQVLLRQELRERVQGLSVSGTEILESLGRRMPAGLQRAIEDTMRHGRELMRERTGVSVQPFVADPPLDIDDEELARVATDLRSRSAQQVYQARAAAATSLALLRPVVAGEIQAWLAFDADFALGCFALRYDLKPASIGNRIVLADAAHLRLADQPGTQRIAYHLGDREAVALLTGANSGGKTTLLELMAQVCIMARLGLPVVGRDVQVPWLDELHVVTARRNLDAGAFESFLRGFLPVVLGGKRRLVLADEVESVTELEAAGRILGFFLDRLVASGSMAVVVTHLAPQILVHTTGHVRVDGIEATGLDERNRLVVDRAPRIGMLARSTPELIIQRLAATAKGAHRELYADLLASFQAGKTVRQPALNGKDGPGKGKRGPSVSPPS